MIQRIQTVYLFIAAILIALLMFLKLADLTAGGQIYTFNAKGIFQGESRVYNGMAIYFLIWLIAVIHFVVIFRYKKRIFQMRALVFTIILELGLFGMIFFFTYSGFEDATASFKIPVARALSSQKPGARVNCLSLVILSRLLSTSKKPPQDHYTVSHIL